MNVLIRKATVKDLQALLDINLFSFESNATYDPYIKMDWIHTKEAKQHFLRAITNEGYYASLAEADDKAVGFLFLSPKNLSYRTVKMIELDILAVLPAYCSIGIGKKLIEDAKNWAKKNGYQTIYASVYSKNKRAIAFYSREEFSHIDIGMEYSL